MNRLKKVFFAAFPVFLLGLLAAPALAVENWPPPAYEMPYVPYDPMSWNVFKESLKTSMGSMSNIGFILIGVVTSVALISGIFNGLFLEKLQIAEGVRRHELQRAIKSADISKNLDAIVDSKVSDMEVSYLAKSRFRIRHPGLDMEEKIYQKQLAYQADIEFNGRNPELAIGRNKSNREIAFQGKEQFLHRNLSNIHEEAISNRQFSASVDLDYKQRYAELEMSRRELNSRIESMRRDQYRRKKK